MEKFALLNLLKAIDGLSKAQNGKTPAENAPAEPRKENADPPPAPQSADGQNLMYSALVRHETISNRLRAQKTGGAK